MKTLTPELTEKFKEFVENGLRGEVPVGLPLVLYSTANPRGERCFEIPYWQNTEMTGAGIVFDTMNDKVAEFFQEYAGWNFVVRFEYDEETGERNFTHLVAVDFPHSDREFKKIGLCDGWKILPVLDYATLVLTVFHRIFPGYLRFYDRPGYFLHGIWDGMNGRETGTLANQAFLQIFPSERSRGLLAECYADREGPPIAWC